MRVLVTRPQPGAARTANRLAELGFAPVLMPVTEAVGETGGLGAAVERAWSALALTSAAAARVLGENEAAMAAWRDLPVHAVGARTAAAARAAGFTRVGSAEGGGADLARHVARTAPARPVLYCAGDPRAAAFEEQLRAGGVPFETVIVYRMEPVGYSAEELAGLLLGLPFDASLFYSRATTSGFFELAARIASPGALRLGRILCLSEQVRDGLPAALRAGAAVADAPTEDGLLALLAGRRN